ncbi:hypothetical protein LZ654_04405 [Lelliottia amnigena]|uniref:hypothetical protein n=1 Tax=Lelliottia amnigena TaxID=61646 RepID=UPI001F29A5A9|nr:hypothetical protein [Lelliottia amnigena]MCE9964084.1 hypothetical protein [Lelliottia amnigena]
MRHTTTRLIAVVAGMAQMGLLKAGLPEKGRRKITLSVCFFNYNYSPLFTLNKNIINTVS